MPEDLLTIPQVAEVLGVKPVSARAYHENAQRNRRENGVRSTDMPEPDRRFGRTPVWKRSTIDDWMKIRTPRPHRTNQD